MITRKDIEKLKEIFVTKEEFHSKFTELGDRISLLTNSIDLALKRMDNRDQESIIQNYRLEKAEEWIHKASRKMNIKFEH